MALKKHRASANRISPAHVAIVVVSDSITPGRDESGRLAARLLAAHGHRVVHHDIVPNAPKRLTRRCRSLLREKMDMIMTIGGTGISKKDASVESVSSLMEKRLDGFGEMFRRASAKEIGTAAMMSRASLGVAGTCILVCLPGSPSAVRLALTALILPELGHLLSELHKG